MHKKYDKIARTQNFSLLNWSLPYQINPKHKLVRFQQRTKKKDKEYEYIRIQLSRQSHFNRSPIF